MLGTSTTDMEDNTRSPTPPLMTDEEALLRYQQVLLMTCRVDIETCISLLCMFMFMCSRPTCSTHCSLVHSPLPTCNHKMHCGTLLQHSYLMLLTRRFDNVFHPILFTHFCHRTITLHYIHHVVSCLSQKTTCPHSISAGW